MYENLIFPLVVLIFLVFVLIIPVLLYRGLKKLADPVPPWIPVGLAIVTLFLLAVLQRADKVLDLGALTGTTVMFALMFLLVSLAVVTPYFYFEKKTGTDAPWLIFSLLSFVGCCLFFYTTMAELLHGMPLPLFNSRMPGSGWFLDTIISALSLNEFVYAFESPVYLIGLAICLYLDVLVIAAMYYAVLNMATAMSQQKNR
ncbi:MAG: hypothetical protein M0R30_00295 [Methanoregula sp.]|jgi:hypothetical protein|uniref:hypothetical protein n=1 Tax=Methanoregula sp. TaxID=2052170 RepID=UPI0025D8E533|nr:hypothetical protein [Methanoregula sp.]MCK9630059.1 hypothetical protein [Methanoregula sp.]